jgi:hypothetical protein
MLIYQSCTSYQQPKEQEQVLNSTPSAIATTHHAHDHDSSPVNTTDHLSIRHLQANPPLLAATHQRILESRQSQAQSRKTSTPRSRQMADDVGGQEGCAATSQEGRPAGQRAKEECQRKREKEEQDEEAEREGRLLGAGPVSLSDPVRCSCAVVLARK